MSKNDKGDVHPDLGERIQFDTFDEAVRHVKGRYPHAHRDGSAGKGCRTWWCGETLVGYQWPVSDKKPSEKTYLRLRSNVR